MGIPRKFQADGNTFYVVENVKFDPDSLVFDLPYIGAVLRKFQLLR